MHRSAWERFWRTVWLATRLVGRRWEGVWIGPQVAWETAYHIHRHCVCTKCRTR
jgi:hypothetical protein